MADALNYGINKKILKSVRGGSGLTFSPLSRAISGGAINVFGNWTTALSGATMNMLVLGISVKQDSNSVNDMKQWQVGYGSEGNEVPVTVSDTVNPTAQDFYDFKPMVINGYIASGNRVAVRNKPFNATVGVTGSQSASLLWMPSNY